MNSVVETATTAGWVRSFPGQHCTVAALAAHVAEGDAGFCEVVRGMLVTPMEETPHEPFRPTYLDRLNGERARVNAHRPKLEVRELLVEDGSKASSTIRVLTAVQLIQTAVLSFDWAPVSVRRCIEDALMGHPQEHLDTLGSVFASDA